MEEAYGDQAGGVAHGSRKTDRPLMGGRYAQELEALRAVDDGYGRRTGRCHPVAVRTFILGSREPIEYNGRSYQIQKNILEMMRW